jgi:hypothetical protein
MNNNAQYKYTYNELELIDDIWEMIDDLKMKEIEFRK